MTSNKFKCIYHECLKMWDKEPSRDQIIAHSFDDHRTNLGVLDDKGIKGFIRGIKPYGINDLRGTN